MYPEQLVNADFVRITEVHLDVPLYWQSWRLNSELVGTVGAAVLGAADALRRVGG